jgi:hypothetical protein
MFDCRIEKGFNPITIRIETVEDLEELINILDEHYHKVAGGSDDYPENIADLRQDLIKLYKEQKWEGK